MRARPISVRVGLFAMTLLEGGCAVRARRRTRWLPTTCHWRRWRRQGVWLKTLNPKPWRRQGVRVGHTWAKAWCLH